MSYGSTIPEDLSSRSDTPFVAIMQGYRRKIGPRSRYGFNPKTGDQVPKRQRQKTSTRLGTMPTRLGSKMPATESAFASEMRQQRATAAERAAKSKAVSGKMKEEAESANAARAETDRKLDEERENRQKAKPSPATPWRPYNPAPLPSSKKKTM